MSEKELQIKICDECRKEESYDKRNPVMGGFGPFASWFRVETSGRLMKMSGEGKPRDFCSITCIHAWVSKKKEEWS